MRVFLLKVILQQPYGQSADLWAVGTVLFRCISGAHPFVPNEACLAHGPTFRGVCCGVEWCGVLWCGVVC